jgi:CheY-like chemotaxis protein
MPGLKKILLVEDNLNDIELTMAALESNNFANEVVVARHGEEALDYLYRRGQFAARADENPIVVFLDLKMPKVDGLEVLRQVIPVVMLTSSREEPDLANCYRLGANAYIVKPVGFQQFVDAIRQAGAFWAVINEAPPPHLTK